MKKTIKENCFDVMKVPNFVDQTYKTHLCRNIPVDRLLLEETYFVIFG